MEGFAGLVDLICDSGVISSQTLAETLNDLFGNNSSLQDGVERCLCEHNDDFEAAVSALLTTRTAAIVAAQQIDPQWPRTESKENSIKRVLSKLGLPIHQNYPSSIGAIQVLNRLNSIHTEFLADKSKGHISPDIIRSISLNAWTYVERLIRITIRFYETLHCDAHPALNDLFHEAKTKHSLGPLFYAMQKLDKGFLTLPIEQRKYIEQYLGRETPFTGFNINSYLEFINDYRNFFAHSVIEQIETVGEERVEEALHITINMVKELHKKNIAPSVIFLIAQGQDEHGRDIIWFVDEVHAFEKLEIRCKHQMCMFKRNSGPLFFRSPCLTISPLHPRMYEPPLWTLSEISGADLDE